MIFRRLAKDSSIYGGADFFTKLVLLFAFPIIATVLSPKEFGALELIYTSTALFALLMNCGLNNAVQRFYWDKDTTPEQQPTVVTSGFVAMLIFGILAFVIGVCTVLFIYPKVKTDNWIVSEFTLVMALLAMTLTQWIQYALDVIRLHSKPWRFFILALVSRSVSIVFGLIAVVVFGFGIDGLLTAQATVLVFVIPLALWFIRHDLILSKFNMNSFKELVSYGYPFIYVSLAYWLFGSMDRWMLASYSSVEEVGIYSVAFRFASVALFVSSAFGQAWSPFAMKIRTEHSSSYREIYGNVLLVLFFVMILVGGFIALFSGEIINLIMPDEYLPSALPLSILCFSIILQSTLQVTAIGISLEKKTYIFARLAWLTAMVNFIGNWLLIPDFGAIGAAWATLLSYMILTLSYLYFTQRLHPLVIQWGRLLLLAGLGFFIAIASFFMIADDFYWFNIILKALIVFICFVLGLRFLPNQLLKSL